MTTTDFLPQPPANVIFILGGTAAYEITPGEFGRVVARQQLETPYGRSPLFCQLEIDGGRTVWFSSRHGRETLAHSARFVNHRANIWAVRALGGSHILSWNGVGAINPHLRVGDAVVPTCLLDWTRHRHNSFGPASHPSRAAARTIDHINSGANPRQAAHPFAAAARHAILNQITPRPPADQPFTYVCTEGPRLETAAEIRLAGQLGADVVGMTLCPEVWLAAELGLNYASLCLVTNFATGLWHIDPRRDFGAGVARRALPLLLAAAAALLPAA